jgi:hypothetical protein
MSLSSPNPAPLRRRLVAWFALLRYRPERHYMRGARRA